MAEPKYRLEGIVHTRTEEMEDFEGPLDVIFLLLSKNNRSLPRYYVYPSINTAQREEKYSTRKHPLYQTHSNMG